MTATVPRQDILDAIDHLENAAECLRDFLDDADDEADDEVALLAVDPDEDFGEYAQILRPAIGLGL